MKLLAIDCATEWVSAALWLDGACLERSAPPRRGLSEELLVWCASLLDEAGIALHVLDLIAFGRGPGAFTGVRMATGVAQGLAWSTGLPVAAISTLRAVAHQALQRSPQAAQVLVCQDARMNEVYWARHQRHGADTRRIGEECLSSPERVTIPAPADIPQQLPPCVAAGSGFGAYPLLQERWHAAHGTGAGAMTLLLDCPPRARDIAALAALDGLAAALPAAEAAPVYLRDSVATPPVPRPA